MSSSKKRMYFHATFRRRSNVRYSGPRAKDFLAFRQRYLVTFSADFEYMEFTACSISKDLELETERLFELLTPSGLRKFWVTDSKFTLDDIPSPKWKGRIIMDTED
ncbi:hypothetical protein FPOAC1_005333 [Fusarium poae]|uniref:hypothetical protein n=1 Tax=Fusarium poae TaxID=36050 RepID=UPI001CEB1FF0|nr:hypothetical protein FPOAC1_005333 [Fusarium poae]KAG8672072.1 hypothetical protein FPOAC1_005333 [Fusarium poae]